MADAVARAAGPSFLVSTDASFDRLGSAGWVHGRQPTLDGRPIALHAGKHALRIWGPYACGIWRPASESDSVPLPMMATNAELSEDGLLHITFGAETALFRRAPEHRNSL